MKYSFLWATYRQKKSTAVWFSLFFIIPSLFNILNYLDGHYHFFNFFLANPKSSVGRLLDSNYFWQTTLFNFIPFLLLIFVPQKNLIRLFDFWLILATLYSLTNSWYINTYSILSVTYFYFIYRDINRKNKELMDTYIQNSKIISNDSQVTH